VRVGLIALNALMIIIAPAAVDWGLPLTYPNLCSLAWSASMLVTFLVTMIKQVCRLAAEESLTPGFRDFTAQGAELRLATVPVSGAKRLNAQPAETSRT
jgi:hypothetical protein